MYRRQGNTAIIDYFVEFFVPPGLCGIGTPDTLAIIGATLVRHVPVTGGGPVNEVYERR